MANITKHYFKVLEVLNSLNVDFNHIFRAGIKAKMSDIEVVALSLTAEYMSINSEDDLFKQLVNSSILNLIELSQFNKRRRKLFEISEIIRTTLACSFFRI